MKKSELFFNLISVPVDSFSLFLAGVVSFKLRQTQQSLDIIGPIKNDLTLTQFTGIIYQIIPAVVLIFALVGLYNLKSTRRFVSEFGKILVGISSGLFLVILLFFFNHDLFQSRFIILSSWGVGIIFVVFGRLILKQIQILLFKSNFGLHKLIIITRTGSNLSLIERIVKNVNHGYKIVAELPFTEDIFTKLENFKNENQIDEILQADTSLSDQANLKLVEFARNRGLKFSFVPNLFEVQRNIVETDNLNGIPVITLKNTPLDGWGKVAKRVLDIILSLVCIVLTLPVFLVVWLAIKIDSEGKAIYSAERGGRGKNFQFYKFRTMYSHLSVGEKYGGAKAEKIRSELWKQNDRGGESAPFLKIKDDPRVTKVGKFLRRTKLDEIPQFWNVLMGDMSMVGPRAHVLDEVARYKASYQRMFSIKPGIFGLSQMAQVSWPDLPFEEEIRLNTFYIENWSVYLDIKILTQSFFLLFFKSKNEGDY